MENNNEQEKTINKETILKNELMRQIKTQSKEWIKGFKNHFCEMFEDCYNLNDIINNLMDDYYYLSVEIFEECEYPEEFNAVGYAVSLISFCETTGGLEVLKQNEIKELFLKNGIEEDKLTIYNINYRLFE